MFWFNARITTDTLSPVAGTAETARTGIRPEQFKQILQEQQQQET
jgi:hypothetical protein